MLVCSRGYLELLSDIYLMKTVKNLCASTQTDKGLYLKWNMKTMLIYIYHFIQFGCYLMQQSDKKCIFSTLNRLQVRVTLILDMFLSFLPISWRQQWWDWSVALALGWGCFHSSILSLKQKYALINIYITQIIVQL